MPMMMIGLSKYRPPLSLHQARGDGERLDCREQLNCPINTIDLRGRHLSGLYRLQEVTQRLSFCSNVHFSTRAMMRSIG